MFRRFWLIFAQSVTVSLGALSVWAVMTDRHPVWVSNFQPATDIRAVSAVERAAPSVVTIFSRSEQPDKLAEAIGLGWNNDPVSNLTACGSGVIVSAEGYILTNLHVVKNINSLCVILTDGRRFDATVAGTDPETDLALLKISGEKLPAVTFGETSKLRVGQPVLAIGNPLEVGQTVTAGIISALGRHNLGLNLYEDFIQTDAAINPGNSGGALIDNEGRLIGLSTAVLATEASDHSGIGFATPVSIIRQVLPSLREGRPVTRGYLGIVAQQLSPELAHDLGLSVSEGVMIKNILPGSPASKAGLRAFDVVLSLNGTETVDANRLLADISALAPGDKAVVRIRRGKKEMEITATAALRKQTAQEREFTARHQH